MAGRRWIILVILGVIQLLRLLPSAGECLCLPLHDSARSWGLCSLLSPFLFETNGSPAVSETLDGILISCFLFFFLFDGICVGSQFVRVLLCSC
jgi:hypothetical protein